MTPKKYKSLPFEVEAILYNEQNWLDIDSFVRSRNSDLSVLEIGRWDDPSFSKKGRIIEIKGANSFQSVCVASVNDYIILCDNQFFVLEKEVFEKKYREVGE